jgi:hypothetical protein
MQQQYGKGNVNNLLRHPFALCRNLWRRCLVRASRTTLWLNSSDTHVVDGKKPSIESNCPQIQHQLITMKLALAFSLAATAAAFSQVRTDGCVSLTSAAGLMLDEAVETLPGG